VVRAALLALCIAAACTGSASAQQASGSFNVVISLTGSGNDPPAAPQTCVTQSLTSAPNAIVHVACPSGNFVGIEPMPGKPFLGTHGGAFRFNFLSRWPGYVPPGDDPTTEAGIGTVTALRVLKVGPPDQPLEILIAF
jgi:hypothetical protein